MTAVSWLSVVMMGKVRVIDFCIEKILFTEGSETETSKLSFFSALISSIVVEVDSACFV